MEKSPSASIGDERSRDSLIVSYSISPSLPPEYTDAYDIAIGGLAMFTNAALAPNLELTIDLALRDSTHPPLRLEANVRWSTYDPLLEKYRTGVSFETDCDAAFEIAILHYIDALAERHAIRSS